MNTLKIYICVIIYANEICNIASGKNEFFKRIFPKVKVVFLGKTVTLKSDDKTKISVCNVTA